MRKLLLVVALLLLPFGFLQAEPTTPEHICGPAETTLNNLQQKGWNTIWMGYTHEENIMVMENNEQEWMLIMLTDGVSKDKPDTVVKIACLMSDGTNSTHVK